MKTVKWQADKLVQEITGINIQKTLFKKKDFDKEAFEQD